MRLREVSESSALVTNSHDLAAFFSSLNENVVREILRVLLKSRFASKNIVFMMIHHLQLCRFFFFFLIKPRPRAHFSLYSRDVSTLRQSQSYFRCVTVWISLALAEPGCLWLQPDATVIPHWSQKNETSDLTDTDHEGERRENVTLKF